ncbi:hypothetical protein MFIFM68171_04469 [Madurella fahalii]|uniref:protein-ribulosamine 3-kinase n=1 Tax=Madurella fahalii TaxID=1157608 RepID=A0ABQ0G927_9PEZI
MNYKGAEGLEFGGGNTKLDPAVLAELPAGCTVLSTDGHGVSFWANTARIDVRLTDETEQSFFIKVLSGETGKNMVQAEFESMNAIHSVLPDFAPKPIAYGPYQTLSETYFFLCEFRDMTDELPDPNEFTARLAYLHQQSISPTGKFGFHTTTYAGNLPQMVEWEERWEIFFAKSLRQAFDLEIAAKGSDPELEELIPVLFDKVIPRLLRPLESDGRSVKPSLVHGDLWYANAGLDASTGRSLIFDACCFYAHNEYEFGQWRPACNRFDEKFLQAYHQRLKPSQPEEDYEGRLDLYKLRFNTHVSALFFENQTLREQVLGDIRDLVQRYGGDAGKPPN